MRNGRFSSRLLAVTAVGLLSGLGSTAAFAETPLAELTLEDLQHRRHDLSEFHGRVVVLNFWATWCVPCRQEMPVFVRLQERRGAEGVQVVGASADEAGNERVVEKFVQDMGIHFPVWTGATTVDMERLGLGTALPATAILDRDGSIVARAPGIIDADGLERWIDWLLGDRTAIAPPPPIGVPIPTETKPHVHHHEDHDHHDTGVGLDGPSLVPS